MCVRACACACGESPVREALDVQNQDPWEVEDAQLHERVRVCVRACVCVCVCA